MAEYGYTIIATSQVFPSVDAALAATKDHTFLKGDYSNLRLVIYKVVADVKVDPRVVVEYAPDYRKMS